MQEGKIFGQLMLKLLYTKAPFPPTSLFLTPSCSAIENKETKIKRKATTLHYLSSGAFKSWSFYYCNYQSSFYTLHVLSSWLMLMFSDWVQDQVASTLKVYTAHTHLAMRLCHALTTVPERLAPLEKYQLSEKCQKKTQKKRVHTLIKYSEKVSRLLVLWRKVHTS